MPKAIVWRQFNRYRKSDIMLLERICRESGSVSVAKHTSFLQTAVWYTEKQPEKLWCEILNDSAFYMCICRKGYVRGVDTVVLERFHGMGYGRILNNRRLERMRREGIPLFKFRTNRDDSALGFWLKQGARIVDINGCDYEMELRIKL